MYQYICAVLIELKGKLIMLFRKYLRIHNQTANLSEHIKSEAF